ncbi:unnamed protein product [Echinostoma caproni]|uniref:Uncharacterized protein n=1 Tax=Echinostoma caproni TaxID=27848 RepID=A0A183A5X4_9TREM|nr:unnamed protein product [Echinostoma caproni]
MKPSTFIRNPTIDRSAQSSTTKPTLGTSIRVFFSRIFRRAAITTDLNSRSGLEHLSCIQCTKSSAPEEMGPRIYLPESGPTGMTTTWEPVGSVTQPTALNPSFLPDYMIKAMPNDACWLAGFEGQSQPPFTKSLTRFLQCPFCLHVAAEGDFRTTMLDSLHSRHFVPSHSTQTFGELDESYPGMSEHTGCMNPLHGSMMTDSGISIESDKVSAARLLSITSAARTPSPQPTPTCFHLSTDPPPSPAPKPVPLVSPMRSDDILRARRHCHQGNTAVQKKGIQGGV